MIRTITIHMIYLLVSMMTGYFIVTQWRCNGFDQADWLWVIGAGILVYLLMTFFHNTLYVETFEINPNIVDTNTNIYQEDNYQQEKEFDQNQKCQSYRKDSSQKRLKGGSCKTNVNIYLDGDLGGNLGDVHSISGVSKPIIPLTKPDRQQQSHALDQSPSTLQHTFDDGKVSISPTTDPAVVNQLRDTVKKEVAKQYPRCMQNNNPSQAITQLHQAVGRKIEERMPYLSNDIRNDVMTHLDQIINEEIDNISGHQASAHLSNLDNPTSQNGNQNNSSNIQNNVNSQNHANVKDHIVECPCPYCRARTHPGGCTCPACRPGATSGGGGPPPTPITPHPRGQCPYDLHGTFNNQGHQMQSDFYNSNAQPVALETQMNGAMRQESLIKPYRDVPNYLH